MVSYFWSRKVAEQFVRCVQELLDETPMIIETDDLEYGHFSVTVPGYPDWLGRLIRQYMCVATRPEYIDWASLDRMCSSDIWQQAQPPESFKKPSKRGKRKIRLDEEAHGGREQGGGEEVG
jgi:hypothetical protein